MRTISIVTSARADYGYYLPIMRAIQADPALALHLIVTGMHLSNAHGKTVNVIEQDGFTIDERIESLLATDSPEGIAKSMGVGVMGFAELFKRFRPDILLVLGDRFEMCVAPLAALPFKIPVAHLHGGELTQGAIDDALRHMITKLSHLHFVATQAYARRVIQMGEEPWRVTVCGAPSLDNLHSLELWSRATLQERLNFPLDPAPLLVTFHPVTLEYEQTAWQIGELLAALDAVGMPVIFSAANADTSGEIVNQCIADYVEVHANALLVQNLGTQAYFSLMQYGAGMVGNSSSGIIEAASFKLPVVNIGTRQGGRAQGANVLDCGYTRQEILTAIQKATAPHFRASLADLQNPYGAGNASGQIIARLKEVELGDKLTRKVFHDVKNLPD